MIHLNIGSNLDSKYGSDLIILSIAINLLLYAKLKLKKFQIFMKHLLIQTKISKFLNVGLLFIMRMIYIILFKKLNLLKKN